LDLVLLPIPVTGFVLLPTPVRRVGREVTLEVFLICSRMDRPYMLAPAGLGCPADAH
jgi:hypothetical protein